MTFLHNDGYAELDAHAPVPALPAKRTQSFHQARRVAGHWNLSPLDRAAVFRYCSGTRRLNEAVRGDGRRHLFRGIDHRVVRRLDVALARAPRLPEPLVVYRGEKFPRTSDQDGWNKIKPEDGVIADDQGRLEWALEQWPIGCLVPWAGFTSYSTSPRTAARFTSYDAHRVPVLFRTALSRFAHPPLHCSFMRECDILVPRGAVGTVTAIGLEGPIPGLSSWSFTKRPAVVVDVNLAVPGWE